MPKGKKPKTLWADSRYSATTHGTKLLIDVVGDQRFSYPKSTHLIVDCVRFWSGANSTILDYFAGSGTTGHAVINLNREDGGQRKFILIEMGDHFDTVLVPRIKKVAFTSEWKDGKPSRMATPVEAERSPGIVKYMRLESYEDTLNNIDFDVASDQQMLQFDDYLLKYMLQWETRRSETLLNVKKLSQPFRYTLHIHADGQARQQIAEIPETFNYLIGLRVETRRVYNDDDRRYLVYRGWIDQRRVAVIWRETEGWGKGRSRARQGIRGRAAIDYWRGRSLRQWRFLHPRSQGSGADVQATNVRRDAGIRRTHTTILRIAGTYHEQHH